MRSNEEHRVRRAMAALAARTVPDGRAVLKPDLRTERYIKKLAGRISGLVSRSECGDIARLSGTVRLMEACARRLSLSGRMRLPSCGGVVRIEMIMEKLCAGGDEAVTEDIMVGALDAFDGVQGLAMDEYWASPDALRRALCRAWVDVARGVLRAADERIRAEEWVYSGGSGEVPARSSAFCERALQLAMELEKPDLRGRIEEALARVDSSPEAVVRHAHEARALAIMRLDNISSGRHMLENIRWREAFERTSRTEAVLREDPSGTYPAMDADSRDALRREISYIARRLDMGEGAVARCAVNAAGEFSRDDVRNCVCWWLYDDAGRSELVRRLGSRVRLRPMISDRGGRIYMGLVCALTALVSALFTGLCGSLWALPVALILSWRIALEIVVRSVPHILRPRRTLRMEYASLPDDRRTLVVIPALVTGAARARELCGDLEKLGCLENDPNLDFLLLGDFRDAEEPVMPGDDEIISAASACIRDMNARSGRVKYHYLHRARRYAAADGIYRGYARKRGALMALGRLMTGRGSDEFSAECACVPQLAGRFRYVVTLDADTRMLPGDACRMVGAIAHPLNRRRPGRGFSVMQPCVENDPTAPSTVFSRLFSGVGGLSTYSVMVSDAVADLTGAGSYCGKGVIDMPAFLDALEGRLDDDRILSHDLIEGILSGAGRINDIAVFDGFPTTYEKYCARLSRWTRGDWQLLPDIFRRDIDPPGRFRMISNLMTSLWEPALLVLLVFSAWTLHRTAFALAAALSLAGSIILRLCGDKNAFRRSCVQLALLPAAAYVRLDAIFRAVYRTFFSGKNLLDWVTSADASGDARAIKTACGAGAILLVPALFAGGWTLPAAALGVLFLLGPGWAGEMALEPAQKEQPLARGDEEMLRGLARDIWGYFVENVTSATCFLPPDNVQEEPDNGPALRTSPTNIAMYLVSCVSARELGFIDAAEMQRRMDDALSTLERMEKWNGHLYNWYDITSAAPLAPLYVSSVDSGNLAAALLLCSRAVSGTKTALRLEKLARDTDFTALYDPSRRLFRIGADVERARLSSSHYDLLASESRILSYVSMMLGQTGAESWRALGRPASLGVLLSWSGTMFEYLMPLIMLPSAPGTLLDVSADGCVAAQMAHGRRMMRPWGVSESGYHAFDMELNYQYRAFGLKELSLEGRTPGHVAAPYASCLALMVRPRDAARNIRRMLDLGWRGRYGLYEAADYTHTDPGIVKSWMAHHQGMALCSVCNCLNGGVLRNIFMDIPEAAALEMLLNEQPAPRIRLRPGPRDEYRDTASLSRASRRGRPDTRLSDVCILGGDGATAIVTARGDVEYRRHGVWANRFTGDLLRRGDTIATYIQNMDTGSSERINSPLSRSTFEAGKARFTLSAGDIKCTLSVFAAPSGGALVRRLRLENTADIPIRARITDAFEPALMTDGELRSHPAFFRLFLRADLSRKNTLIFRRSSREDGEDTMAVFHWMDADCRRCTSWPWFYENYIISGAPDGAAMPEGADGPVLDPGSILQTDAELSSGEIREINMVIGLCGADDAYSHAGRYTGGDMAARQEKLARSHGRSMAEFAGLDAEKSALVQRVAAFMVDPRLAGRSGRGEDARPEGVPWDIPLVCLFMDGNAALPVLRDAIRMHEYCRQLGLVWQLVLVDDSADDYFRPLRDGVEEAIGACHLRDLRFARGGVTLINGSDLSGCARRSLQRSACMRLDGRLSLWHQLRDRLMTLEYAPANGYGDMPADEWDAGTPGLVPGGYSFTLTSENRIPAPWSNIITGEKLGMLITHRGGGFVWHENSRLRRVTGFDNDPVNDGWDVMLYVADLRRNTFARALPGDVPVGKWRVSHMLWGSVFETQRDGLGITTRVFHDASTETLRFMVCVKNSGPLPREISVSAFADWLMGEDASDSARTRAWGENGAVFATGGIPGAAFMACDAPDGTCGPGRSEFMSHGGIMRPDGLMKNGANGGYVVRLRRRLEPSGECTVTFAMGVAGSVQDAQAMARRISQGCPARAALENTKATWRDMQNAFSLTTGDEALDALINGFIPKQVLDGRVRARAGFYQAGGAYGFRDQLQDMLALLPYDSLRVRGHIMKCASRQFVSGDVMHWWHEPMNGVRTHISDDMLFLPLVTAEYVKYTGDTDILDESAGYLADEEIPAGKSDWYGQARPSGEYEPLRAHCLRAFRRAWRRGEHGLLLMGGGDWNDGMNRIGDGGRGESVWLTMFYAHAAEKFAAVLPACEDSAWLKDSARTARMSVEEHGWDGEWYLRAYDDEGEKIGSREDPQCRIDLLSQAWAVIAGMDARRARKAVESARKHLADTENRLIKLLTPPFTGEGTDPGYIAAYPPGVRENGGQYTHAASWYLMALSVLGDAPGVKEAIGFVRPDGRGPEYRAEPYVLAADIYGEPPFAGRGGWTWYTGSAGWFLTALRHVAGFEKIGDMVRMNALSGVWPAPKIRLKHGSSTYTMISEPDAAETTLDGQKTEGDFITLTDDGRDHIAIFPQRT